MFCQFQMYSKVIQLYIHIYVFSLFQILFSYRCFICLLTFHISFLVKSLFISVVHVLMLFTFLVLNFKNSLYILGTSPLSDVRFPNVFSKTVACLFILLTMSYTEQKILTFINSNLPIFSFMDHAFSVVSKNSPPNTSSHRFSALLFSRSFIVLHFTCMQGYNPFCGNFCERCKVCVYRVFLFVCFVCCLWTSSCSSTTLEKTIFSPLHCLCPLVVLIQFKILFHFSCNFFVLFCFLVTQ